MSARANGDAPVVEAKPTPKSRKAKVVDATVTDIATGAAKPRGKKLVMAGKAG